MCGRFALRLPRGDIQRLPGHNVDVDEWIDDDHFVPRYNIAPRSNAPVIRRRDPGSLGSGSGSGSRDDNHSNLVLQTMKWGLVPHWSKFEDKTLSTTNARSENLVEGGGMWGSIKGKKRCAIPCQGYYEWLTKGKEKLPHFTKHSDGRIMLLAGLYDSVVLEGAKEPLWTFTIVTTDANKQFSWLHDRQPVILSSDEALRIWLDTSSQTWTPELTQLVQPYHDSSAPLECYQVPKEVGKIGTESASFIEPVAKRKDGIEAMFSKQKQAKPSSQPIISKQSNPEKRKRSASPISPPHGHERSPELPEFKVERSDDVVIIDEPRTPKKPKLVQSERDETPSRKTLKARSSSPTKAKSPSGTNKITSFFGKSTK